MGAGKFERLPEMAADLVRLKVDLIVAATTSAARAAKQATSTIPIVMTAVGDPVDAGHVVSLARPGGDVTVLALLSFYLLSKLFDLRNGPDSTRTNVGVLL